MLEEHQAQTAMGISGYVYGVAFYSEGRQSVEQGTREVRQSLLLQDPHE